MVDEWQDLLAATIVLVMLIVVGNILDFGAISVIRGEVNLRDEAGLFLLNYVKTETDDGKIANKIILEEGGDHMGLGALQGLTKDILGFMEMGGRSYVLKVGYPDGDVKLIAASGRFKMPGLASGGRQATEEELKAWKELGDGEKMKIPSLKGGLITVEFKLENE